MLRTLSGGEPSSNKWIILCAADKSVRYVKNAGFFVKGELKEVGNLYQVLYRKYRPKVFSDVYGQDHVTSTLINEIKENRISHAYLFTGSRGTGKTSCAKILAKAVNCEHGENGEPCNECEICKGLDSGAIYDVIEIDAASNNGVDNIRDLRDEANYTPSRCKYRVYIIDEVHMLSTEAFNALLKTLEEPPAHVIFILATTEVHKLPATILSRCQRFDFKRIQPETMAVRLKQVAGYEGIELDDDAAILISRIADGALRDALSILDQCAGRNGRVDSKLVSEIAGIAGRESLYELSNAVCDQDGAAALETISRLHANSYDMERLCVEMINHFRNFLIVKTVEKSRGLIICTDDEFETIRESAKKFTLAKIIFALDLFQNTLTVIKGGANSRIEMEMSFIKLCNPKLDVSNDALLDRIEALERAIRNGALPEKSEKPQSDESEKPVINERETAGGEEKPAIEEKKEEKAELAPRKVADGAQNNENSEQNQQMREFEQWSELMDILFKSDLMLYGFLDGARGFIKGDFFLLDSQNPSLRDFIRISDHSKALKQALFELTGRQFKLGLFAKKDGTVAKKDPLEEFIAKASAGNLNIKVE